MSALNIVFSRIDPELFIYPKLVQKAKNMFSICFAYIAHKGSAGSRGPFLEAPGNYRAR